MLSFWAHFLLSFFSSFLHVRMLFVWFNFIRYYFPSSSWRKCTNVSFHCFYNEWRNFLPLVFCLFNLTCSEYVCVCLYISDIYMHMYMRVSVRMWFSGFIYFNKEKIGLFAHSITLPEKPKVKADSFKYNIKSKSNYKYIKFFMWILKRRTKKRGKFINSHIRAYDTNECGISHVWHSLCVRMIRALMSARVNGKKRQESINDAETKQENKDTFGVFFSLLHLKPV